MPEDNSQLINSLLGMLGEHPEEKINAVLSSLTDGGKLQAPEGGAEESAEADTASENEGLPDLSALMKIQGLLSQAGGSNDDRSRLLAALKPFLSQERKPHVDRALQLLKLAKLADAAKSLDLLKDFKL